jgi:hypothetical protein
VREGTPQKIAAREGVSDALFELELVLFQNEGEYSGRCRAIRDAGWCRTDIPVCVAQTFLSVLLFPSFPHRQEWLSPHRDSRLLLQLGQQVFRVGSLGAVATELDRLE